MSKVFTNEEFINKLKWLVNDVPNYYYSKGGTWCSYNKSNSKFMMDCVVSIKGLLWGFSANKNKAHGGGIYLSNGVADFGANAGINYCSDISKNFGNLTKGEYLCMKDTQYNHAGVYLGNGKVFECTTTWNAKKCIISDIDSNGNRYYKGVKAKPWTYHGKLRYIEYVKEPEKPKYTTGKYKLLYDKAIRRTHELSDNIIEASKCTPATKKVLVSPTGKAKIKKGSVITINEIYNQSNRIWGKYGNCWIVLCNIDGKAQAEKIS